MYLQILNVNFIKLISFSLLSTYLTIKQAWKRKGQQKQGGMNSTVG